MGDVITEEIDLRPLWRARSKAGSPARWMWVGGGAGALVLLLALTGGDEPAPEVKRPPPPEPKLRELGGATGDLRDAPPIVIEATPETVEGTRRDPELTSGRGTLALTSDINVVVYDGPRRLGRTPLTVRLPAGRHDLRFVNKKMHLEEKRRFDVRADKKHERELFFGYGSLAVRAPEGTRVFLNSRFQGVVPFNKIVLAEGRHHLKLKHGSAVMSEWVVVPASRDVEFRANFPD